MTRKSPSPTDKPSDPLTALVRIFLESNLSIILIILSLIVGIAALWITPREEDPQIVVPLADVFVNFPGHTAAEVEQLVAAPLERMLYQSMVSNMYTVCLAMTTQLSRFDSTLVRIASVVW